MNKKYIIVICLLLTGCDFKPENTSIQTTANKQHPANKQQTLRKAEVNSKSVPKPYFEFDQIDYYYIDIDEMTFNELALSKKRKKKEQQLLHLVSRGYLESLKDTGHILLAEDLGYIKHRINQNLFPAIHDIFSEKDHENWLSAACIAILRDILVFRKNNKIVGVAKICVTCMQHEIVGTTVNTDFFGQSGDYDKLITLLRGKQMNIHPLLLKE